MVEGDGFDIELFSYECINRIIVAVISYASLRLTYKDRLYVSVNNPVRLGYVN